MKQAIITRYISPTSIKPGRIKATADAGAVTVPWDHSKTMEQNHVGAAITLCARLGWLADFHTGSLPGDGYAHVFPVC